GACGVAGRRGRPNREGRASRSGRERGYCVVMGQRVPVQRAARADDRRQRSASGQLRNVPPWRAADGKLLLGLITRRYGQAVHQFSKAYGLEKVRSANISSRRGGEK